MLPVFVSLSGGQRGVVPRVVLSIAGTSPLTTPFDRTINSDIEYEIIVSYP
jgi:hypothetical protein